MDYKLALIVLPVRDVDVAKDFYTGGAGFAVDYDMAPSEHYRIVQLTPTGSATSIAIGTNLTQVPATPGSVQGLRLVVDDVEKARQDLVGRGVDVTEIDDRPWGQFAWFSDPDGNGWELSQPTSS